MLKYRIVERILSSGSNVFVEAKYNPNIWERWFLGLDGNWRLIKAGFSTVSDAKHWIDQRTEVKRNIIEYP
jgi:hypothetical protein